MSGVYGLGFADPEKELAHAEKTADIIRLRQEGVPVSEIAGRLDMEPRQIYRIISSQAAAVRERVGDTVEEAFMLQVDRLEAMYRLAGERLRALPAEATSGEFCNCVRAIVLIFERQARLLNIDREKTQGGANKADWLDGASEDELRAWALKNKLPVPEKFRT